VNFFSLIIPLTTAIMSLSVGALLFTLKVPDNKALDSYNTSRKVMAYVYFSLGLINTGQMFLGNSDHSNESFLQTLSGIYIIIASLQAFLLTYSLITLIDAYYVTCKKILIQLIPVTILSGVTVMGFFSEDSTYLKSTLIVFSVYYLFQLISYTRLFFLKERQFIAEAKNFFSENEERRIKWVKTAFLSSLGIGIWAFSIVLFPHAVFLEQSFSIVCIVFYLYFGIHFINYVQAFHLLMPIIAPDKEQIVKDKTPVNTYNNDLSTKLDQWIANKSYSKAGITINQLAEQMNTNRTYISNHINSNERVNFNRWLNGLRIQEAKRVMKSQPEMPLNELADLMGYTDQSCFSKQFKYIEGQSPISWKKENSN
jgi:AraC-like DNA-binding protein